MIKCGRKNIAFSHVFDYLAMELLKLRSYESLWLLLDIKMDKEKKPCTIPKLNANEYSSLYKMQRMKYMDKFFNPIDSNDMSYESGINHAKYVDELEAMTERC